MAKREREYPLQYKIWVLQQVADREKPIKRLCEELGLNRSQVYRWQHKYLDDGVEALERKAGNPRRRRGVAVRPPGPAEEIARLQKKVGELQVQVDFLTQACKQVGEPASNSTGGGAKASIAKSEQ